MLALGSERERETPLIRHRKARIVATLGPASNTPDMILNLARSGADVFRLNFSHGTHKDHAAAYAAVRAAESSLERPLGVLADLQGPKLRLGVFVGGGIPISLGQTITLDLDTKPGDAKRAPLPHPELLAALSPGQLLLVDDGKVRLSVVETDHVTAVVRVIQGDRLSDRKGVALPGATIPLAALTAKDRTDLAFALRLGVDWVALSFVQQPADMAELRRLVGHRAAVMAKIEKPAALDRLESILDLCDGVMIARGDLGVELEPEEVPVAQKTILRAARRRGVPVIVATQMLESMTASATPTRAEASDVANAVYEGADALMLSGETAAGAFPLAAVSMMDRIITRVERDPRWPELMGVEGDRLDDEDADALVAAARRASETGSTACLVTFTTTGATARRLARERPLQTVAALTPSVMTARRLTLVWGLEPRTVAEPETLDAATEAACQIAASLGLAAPGQRILIVAGTPFGAPGAANLLRLAHAPLPRH